ncbi:uncharacterized protein LOC132054327 [Lycium ferocissimum]|uniref:uncharacterized protein LOC132054327 n=1 Tax=Lycium ferocissimum TaxID=112874 RepID=UPI0028151A5B|nr:uncharacterized protein LOC132054327 [Lycium ferocissimum]
MDFVIGLPHSRHKYDSIWVIVDRLTKSAHFLPVRSTYSAEDYARLYLKEIVWIHGIPISIITDRGAQFTAKFWRSFQEGLGTQVKFSTAFHPQTDGQAERTIQTLEDMLRACALDFGDRQVRKLRNKEIASVKVLWRNDNREEMTWEAEEAMKIKYPHLFPPPEEAQDGTSVSPETWRDTLEEASSPDFDLLTSLLEAKINLEAAEMAIKDIQDPEKNGQWCEDSESSPGAGAGLYA